MKRFVAALIFAAVIVMLGIWHTAKIEKLSSELLQTNKKISESIMKDDFKTAEQEIEKVKNIVDENRMMLTLSMDHSELDKIEMNVAQASAYVSEEKREDALSFANVLDNLFERLPKNYRLRIENIL